MRDAATEVDRRRMAQRIREIDAEIGKIGPLGKYMTSPEEGEKLRTMVLGLEAERVGLLKRLASIRE
jgi:hypothetical protein